MGKVTAGVKHSIYCSIILIVILAQSSLLTAQELVWRGYIPSNGQDIGPITLISGATYSVEVSGTFSMGRWWQNNREIINDPCYEFNAHSQPTPIPVLENNLGINYCSQYNPRHVYQSANFISNGQQLWFRIFDTDYRDNRGGLTVAVYIHQTGSSSGQFQTIKLFNAVKRQNSTNFKANLFHDVYVNTKKWDTTPYHLNKPFNFRISVPYGRKVYLSSRSDSKKGFFIDNFLMFVINNGGNYNVFSLGSVPSHTYKGRNVTLATSRTQNPGSPDITKYFPVGIEVNVTVFALDFGGVGGMSDVYLHVR